MKKAVSVILMAALVLAGCSKPSTNNIQPAKLSNDQQEILNMVFDGDISIGIYDYKFRGMSHTSVFLETYRNGALDETIDAMEMAGHEGNEGEGRMVFKVDMGSEPFINVNIDGVQTKLKLDIPDEFFKHYSGLVRGEGNRIKDGEDIVLLSIFFDEEIHGVTMMGKDQEFDTNILQEYDYVILLKLRFFNKA